MFENIRFAFRINKINKLLDLAVQAAKSKNTHEKLRLLREVLICAFKAQRIESSKITVDEQRDLAAIIFIAKKKYIHGMLEYMPDYDRNLVMSVTKFWGEWIDMGGVQTEVTPIEQIINMFDIAKSCLCDGGEAFGILYSDDRVPAQLWNIMQPFLAKEVTLEETEAQLDRCIAVLRKWLPEMFSEKLLLA